MKKENGVASILRVITFALFLVFAHSLSAAMMTRKSGLAKELVLPQKKGKT